MRSHCKPDCLHMLCAWLLQELLVSLASALSNPTVAFSAGALAPGCCSSIVVVVAVAAAAASSSSSSTSTNSSSSSSSSSSSRSSSCPQHSSPGARRYCCNASRTRFGQRSDRNMILVRMTMLAGISDEEDDDDGLC